MIMKKYSPLILIICYVIINLAGQFNSVNHNKTMMIKGLSTTTTDFPAEAKVLSIIGNSFVNSNGMLSDCVKGGQSHGYALSESMGQIMEYAVAIGNEDLFDAAWQVTVKHFRSPKGYFYWRVKEDGLVIDDATALVDELRLINALASAAKKFKRSDYTLHAEHLTKAIYKYSGYSNHLCDAYEAKSKITVKNISLFYIDPHALQQMAQLDPTVASSVKNTLKILRDAPINECGFFPEMYDYRTRGYRYKQEVNMVEMLYTARNAYETDCDITPFLNFMKKELDKGHIFNSYRRDGTSIGNNESTAVYALACRMFLNAGNRESASQCYKKMLGFQIKEEGDRLNGAFGDRDSITAYAFDQMEALITLHEVSGIFSKI